MSTASHKEWNGKATGAERAADIIMMRITMGTATSKADAVRIINEQTAAPALLEALKGMLEWARRVKERNSGPEVFNAIAAIALAKGEQL